MSSVHEVSSWDTTCTSFGMKNGGTMPKGGISLEEWEDFVHDDDEMRLDGFAEITTPDGSKLRMESAGLAVWTGYSKNIDGGNQAWLHFRDCSIVVKKVSTVAMSFPYPGAGRISLFDFTVYPRSIASRSSCPRVLGRNRASDDRFRRPW